MLLLKICKYEEVCFKVLSTVIRGLEKGHNDGEYTDYTSTRNYKEIKLSSFQNEEAGS